MKHLIIGCGVVGDATGHMLESIGEDVYYSDIDINKLQGKKTLLEVRPFPDIGIYWICTAEWNTEEVCSELDSTYKIVVIRSTVPPRFTDEMQKKYDIQHIAHCPEFLRANFARQDTMNPDRIVIGTRDMETLKILWKIFRKLTANGILTTTPTESSLIKLMSNAYLSTQISFWNEIDKICKEYSVCTKTVVEGCKGDHRIGYYGTDPTKGKFGGFCLPKDLITLIKVSKKHKLLKAVKKVNDEL